MNIELVTGASEIADGPLLVLGAFTDGSLTASAGVLPADTAARLSALVVEGGFWPAAGSQLHLFEFSAALHRKILLIGLGPNIPLYEAAYRAAIDAAARTLAASRCRWIVVALTEVEVVDRTCEWRIELAARLLADGCYRLTLPRGAPSGGERMKNGADRISLVVHGEVEDRHRAAARRGVAIAEGVALAGDLADAPADICTPAFLGETARAIGRRFALHVEVFERVDLISLGMEALVALGETRERSSSLIVMSYRGGPPAAKPIVLIGAGIVVDAGGALAAANGRWGDSTPDMSAAATLLGTIWAVARCGVSINLLGLAPTATIHTAALPTRLGKIASSMAGQTIGTVDLDAAGLLVVCDVLSYAQHLNAACVIDLATSSGAAAGPHGADASVLVANDAGLAKEILASGIEAADLARPFPWRDGEQRRGDAADGGDGGGALTGVARSAGILARFAGGTRWAHLDITGIARVGVDGKVTGRPVALLTTFLVRRAAKGGRADLNGAARSKAAPPSGTV